MHKDYEKYLQYLWENINSHNQIQDPKNTVSIYYHKNYNKLYLFYDHIEHDNNYPFILENKNEYNSNDLTKILSLNEIIDKKLKINNFNQNLFLKHLLETLTVKEKKIICYSFTNIIYFIQSFQSFLERHNVSYLEEFSKILNFEDFKFLISNLPNITTMINKTSFAEIFKIIDKNFSIEKRNELLLALILKNKKTILAYKNQHITLQNFLLKVFNDDTEESKKQLTIYSEHFTFIFYAINHEIGKNYIEPNKNKECVFFEINAKKMIAHNKIMTWRINEYKTAIDTFFKEFIKYYDEINSFNTFIDKEDKNDYLCISIFKNNTNGIQKEKVISIVYNYLNDLKNVKKLLSVKDQEKFISTWLSHYHLNEILPIKESNSKITKI